MPSAGSWPPSPGTGELGSARGPPTRRQPSAPPALLLLASSRGLLVGRLNLPIPGQNRFSAGLALLGRQLQSQHLLVGRVGLRRLLLDALDEVAGDVGQLSLAELWRVA